MQNDIPVLGICAAGSNAGKTTLITKLIDEFSKRNIRVSVIKHAHHQFDIDHPGKDSYKIREAGAVQTLVASKQRWALVTEMSRTTDFADEADLSQLLAQLNPDYADLILVEGFKQARIPKIEVFNDALQQSPLAADDTEIIALVADVGLALDLPIFKSNAVSQIADFIQTYLKVT